ncbi:MAG: tRNA pseudouridine(38-40) synthase TruA [Cyanobacteriota bacterium]|nr:tRNA pseudouridine(38-40) synthase TruA [Cyanobacteriota bacterium]
MALRRIALCLQYDGSAFHGWQRQHNAPSVQQTLEEALRDLDPAGPAVCVGAGRTDAGVHAAGQVAHFDCLGPIPPQRWPKALNGRLPASIRVRAARAVDPNWHACFSACSRRYRYTLYNGRLPNLFLEPWSWHRYQRPIEQQRMAAVLEAMEGTHDFSAFMRAGSRRRDAITTLQQTAVHREGDLITVELQASGFLYGMVRLLMGQLVAVGEGQLAADILLQRWREQQRQAIKESAPAKGLCLLQVGYPQPVFEPYECYAGQPRFQLDHPDPSLRPSQL